MAIKNQNANLKNVAIIMDGNGRWARKNSLKISQGHKKGVQIVREIVEESILQNIDSLTIYAFSSENWQRPKSEINAIKKLVIDAINDQVPESETFCEDYKLNLNVALSYGGKQDILDLVKKISKEVFDKKLNIDDIDESKIHESSCAPVNEIDLLIRTGGDKRISNFLLYQIAYAEIMFIDKFWPEFSKKDFKECVSNFQKVSRRFGKRV